MGATNSTTNYQLPIFIGSDTPSWLIDWNNAMTAIDTAIAAAKASGDTAQSSNGLTNAELTNLKNVVDTTVELLQDNIGATNANTQAINGLSTAQAQQAQNLLTIGNNISEIRSVAGWVYAGALSVGETTLTIDCTNGLSDDALVDIYIDKAGVTPEAVEAEGTLLKFTFAEQSEVIRVRVKVSGV